MLNEEWLERDEDFTPETYTEVRYFVEVYEEDEETMLLTSPLFEKKEKALQWADTIMNLNTLKHPISLNSTMVELDCEYIDEEKVNIIKWL